MDSNYLIFTFNGGEGLQIQSCDSLCNSSRSMCDTPVMLPTLVSICIKI